MECRPRQKSHFANFDIFDLIRYIDDRNTDFEGFPHPMAAQKLRELANGKKVTLRVIQYAAEGKLFRPDLPRWVTDEYKKWKRVYEVARRLR